MSRKPDRIERQVRRDYERFEDLISQDEARELREAAVAFARSVSDPVRDPDDREGQKLNKRLMRAALAYAEARR